MDNNKNSIKGKTLPDASPYQALQHQNDPSQYRSLGEYNNEGYTHLNSDHQPVYGKLDREPELYEATNGTPQQPIYKELNHSQPEYGEVGSYQPEYKTVGNEQSEYREVDNSQPVYKELNIQEPQYGHPGVHQPEYGKLFHPPEYGELDVGPPEYRELDQRPRTDDQEPIYKELNSDLPDHIELDNLDPVYRELEPENEDPENIYANNTQHPITHHPDNKPLSKPNPKPKPTPRSENHEAKKPTTNEPVNVRIYFSNPVVPPSSENRADVNQLYAPVIKN